VIENAGSEVQLTEDETILLFLEGVASYFENLAARSSEDRTIQASNQNAVNVRRAAKRFLEMSREINTPWNPYLEEST